MTEQEARAERNADAEQRWPIPINYLEGDKEHTLLIAQRQAYLLGRIDEASRSPEAAPAKPVSDTDRKPDPDEAVRIARAATAHNFGETVYEASDASGILRLRMSSWPRAKEAVEGLARAGYTVAQDGNEVMVLAAPAAARASQPVQVEVTDEMEEREAKAWLEGAQHVASRHDGFIAWDEDDNPYEAAAKGGDEE